MRITLGSNGFIALLITTLLCGATAFLSYPAYAVEKPESAHVATATPDNAAPFRLVVAPVGPNNPRNSEGDLIQLKNGALLLAWTEFYAGSGADHGPARIVGKVSKDAGETWSEQYTIIENDGGCNVMEVNLLRLKDDRIALFYCQKNSEGGDCRVMMRTSSDEGRSWSDSIQMSPEGKYTGLTNGRGIRLASGRLLIEAWENGDSYCCLSDDDGLTWRDGGRVQPKDGPCYEPACVELQDGRVMMLMRTGLGGQYKSLSSDGGETWSEPVPTPLIGTAAPVSISRIPSTGDLLAIWNNNLGDDRPGNTGRTPLTAATSSDEGESWENFRNIEEGNHDAWAYPAVTWIDDTALLSYFTYTGGHSLVLRKIPASWFYALAAKEATMEKEIAGVAVSLNTDRHRQSMSLNGTSITLSLTSPKFLFKDAMVIEAMIPDASQYAESRVTDTHELQFAPVPLPEGALEVTLIVQSDPVTRRMHKWARFRVTGCTKPYTLMETVLETLDLTGQDVSLTGAPPQSYPAFWEGCYAGIEHPVASTRLEGEQLILAHRPGITLTPETWYETRRAVYGIAEPGQERAAFSNYIAQHRPTPGGLHFNYNSWWTSSVPFTEEEILGLMHAFHDKLYVAHGVSLDTFAIDMGWSEDKSIWDVDRELFPEGFTRISQAAEAMGSHLGLWTSPSSHYVQALDAEWAEEQGYETLLVPMGEGDRRICCLGGANYSEAFRDRLVAMVTDYGIRHLKLDGYRPQCDESDHGHEAGDYSAEAIAEGALNAFQAIRAAAPATWLETTCFGYNPSPWWLFYVNSVIGTYGDDAPHGRAPSPFYRESYTTARDYFNLQGAARMPIPAVTQEVLGVIHQSDEDFLNDGVTTLMRGHAFTPIYINPKYMNDRRWKAMADLITWARANVDLLAVSEVMLPATWQEQGTPAFANEGVMPREPYGYAHWKNGRGLVLLRNPWMMPASIPLRLQGEGRLSVVSLYPEVRCYAEELQAGTEFDVVLAPYESLVLEIGNTAVVPDLPKAAACVAAQLDVTVTAQQVTRVDYTYEGPRLGKDYTCLIDDSARAARVEIAAEVVSSAERTQLLVLLEGPKTPAAPKTILEINGKESALSVLSSDNGFSASGLPGVEFWAFYGVDLPQGKSLITLKLESRAYAERISVWTFATKQGGTDAAYPNALPAPETLYLDARPLLPTTEISAIQDLLKEAAPVKRIDGVYLDALEPESVYQGWRELQHNLSVWERPITIAGERFDRGLGTHAPSKIVYALEGSHGRFQALVGQDDEVNGTVTFEVWVDDEKRWESGLMCRGEKAKAVDIDIVKAKKLELIVGDGGDNIMADHANWADAKLLR